MKTLILIIAMMLLSINLYSAPPDSCFWAPDLRQTTGTTAILNERFFNEDIFNRDSTLYVDTCGLYPSSYRDSEGNLNPTGGSQYRFEKRYYSKSVWGIEIPWTFFDTTDKDLNMLHYFTAEDIDTEESELFNSFQKIKQKYGSIKFWFSLDKELSIEESWVDNGYYLYIETESLVNSMEFEDYVNELLPNSDCRFQSEISYTVSVKDNSKTLNQFLIYPNPVSDFLMIRGLDESQVQSISIFNTFGQKLYEGDLKEQIDVSSLTPGVYFIRIGDKVEKFVKM